MKFQCKKCEKTLELTKSTTVYRDGSWVVKEALCDSCQVYMDEILTEEHGMPNLIRTEDTYRSGGRGRASYKMQKRAASIKQQIKDNVQK